MGSLFRILASGTSFENLEGSVNSFSVKVTLIAAAVLCFLLLVSVWTVHNKNKKQFKKPLFTAIAAAVVIPTLLLMGSTVYVNTVADSKGPVHWHADIEFWVCGQEIEFRDPYQFLSNKIGTPSLHEHDDKRIHLEGVVFDENADATLGKFMEVTGGSITTTSLTIPTNTQIFENDLDGDQPFGDKQTVESFKKLDSNGRNVVSVQNNYQCGDYRMQKGQLQVFLIRQNNDDTYTQTKLDDPADYVSRKETAVPPGDCLIVDFDTPRERTQHLCEQYGLRDIKRCEEFGVKPYDPNICKLRESGRTLIGGAE